MSAASTGTPPRLDTPVGIVLSGGGMLGDFQVGALLFLDRYLKHNKRPQIFCGTSAGAVNAAGAAACVATGQDVSKLKDLWLNGVTGVEQFFEFEQWFDDLGPNLSTLARGGIVERSYALADIISHSLVDIARHRELSATLVDILKDTSDANLSVLKLDPIRKKFVDLFGGNLKEVVKKSCSVKLAVAAVNLDTGDLEYFCNPPCNGQPGRTRTVRSSPQSLTQAVFASASVPGLLKPAEICSKNYIDGSAREIAPVKAAVDLGAKTLFVVLALPLALTTPSSIITEDEIFDWSVQANFIDVSLRMTNVLLNEILNNDLQQSPSMLSVCYKIDPLQNVHPFFEFHVGLVNINVDYGYMRAFDVVIGPTLRRLCARCRELTEQIIKKRRKIWKLENEFIRDLNESCRQRWVRYYSPLRRVVDTSIIYTIRQQKVQLQQLVEERSRISAGSTLPDHPEPFLDNTERLYKNWETHNWDPEQPTTEPFIDTPWDKIDLGCLGTEVIPKDNP